MEILQLLLGELAVTIADPDVWLSIGLALMLAAGCLAFGTWVARSVGLLKSDAPAGVTVGVGLASGLMVLAAWWAAIWSGGRSSFTPVAVGFAVALCLAVVRRIKRQGKSGGAGNGDGIARTSIGTRWRRPALVALGASACFLVAVALLYGSTMAPSPRDGVQPVEFNDEAFYSVLGRDLAITGTETTLTASGFAELTDVPSQAWYHWGELWLASAVVEIFSTAPIAARYFVVLPVILLAAAALTGALVRQMARSSSRRAYLFGFASCLVLAPVPLPGTFFSSWAAGLAFGINLYGLVVVAVLLAIYCWAAIATIRPTWTLACFVGSVVAFIFPAHLVIAVLAAVGIGAVLVIQIVRSAWKSGRVPVMPTVRHRGLLAAGVLLLATIAWGIITGHGISGSAPSPTAISPFNLAWAYSVAFTYLGAGILLMLPLAALAFRDSRPFVAGMCVGTCAIVASGAIIWGARLSDFNMFHAFFGGIAVFGGPAAAVAVWSLIERLRDTRHLRLALGLALLAGIQLEIGVVGAAIRMQMFGAQVDVAPIPVTVLEAIRQLPSDAKLAYTCAPFEESGFTVPSLLSIDAHTGRRVIPMCFEADVFSPHVGAERSPTVPNTSFGAAPQRVLYPDAASQPSGPEIAAFMKEYRIEYIYADASHPNDLVTDAVSIVRAGDAEILRVPWK
jgi:hypothetical protein